MTDCKETSILEPDELARVGRWVLVGRPNVGKSTLLNQLVQMKLAIVSRKAQTTRHCQRGILTKEVDGKICQIVFEDTPGLILTPGNALEKWMKSRLMSSIRSADGVLFILDKSTWQSEEDKLVKILRSFSQTHPVIAVINKIDQIKEKDLLLPVIEKLKSYQFFKEIIPLSANRRQQMPYLLDAIWPLLEPGYLFYAADEVTDSPECFIVAEYIREKLLRFLGEELPHGMTVVIDSFKKTGRLKRISATIVVSKENHKAMLIGKNGSRLKQISMEARLAIESNLGGQVFLETWVKTKSKWQEDVRRLASLGYKR